VRVANFLDSAFGKTLVASKKISQRPTINVVRWTSAGVVSSFQDFVACQRITLAD
jgi:hypothetical protein